MLSLILLLDDTGELFVQKEIKKKKKGSYKFISSYTLGSVDYL